MKQAKSLPLSEIEVEVLKGQLLIQEIRRIADSLEEHLHMNKYYEREINREALEALHRKIISAARDFA